MSPASHVPPGPPESVCNRVHHRADGALFWIHLDDGSANAMQLAWCDEFNAALDAAEGGEAHSLLITGRERFFSGGLDLKVLPALPPQELLRTTDRFVETMKRLFLFPKPVIAAASGHAIAGGMMLFLAADLRLAVASAEARFGLNEATTGIPLLAGTAGICQHSIPDAHHTELILHGRMMDAAETHVRGITHDLCPDSASLIERAHERAASLREVKLGAYALNKRILRERDWRNAVDAAASLAASVPRGNLFSHLQR